jgi:biopolymer transport protein ExbD
MAQKLDSEVEGFNDINITPFVDVVLVLLVIFMVTAPVMLKESLNIKLPKTLTSDLNSSSVTIGVAITKEGQVFLNGKLFSEDNLLAKLKEVSQTSSKTHFLIGADVESRFGDVVQFIDLLKKNNLNHFAIQIEKIKGP